VQSDIATEPQVASPAAALKLNGSKKGLANEHKRCAGKLVMMRKLGLLEERRRDEAELCAKAPAAAAALGALKLVYVGLGRILDLYSRSSTSFHIY
jgi:hypothetical protein